MTATDPAVLLLAPRVTETGHQLRVAAGLRGLRAFTATSWRAPQELAGRTSHVYGGPIFADAVGRALGLALLEPPADWLARLPLAVTGRQVAYSTLTEARRLRGPAFVKPPADKLFAARVYADGARLPGPELVDGDTPVLVSQVVRFRREYRLFVVDGEVTTGSRYAVDGELSVAPLAREGVDGPTGPGHPNGPADPDSSHGPDPSTDPSSAEVLAFAREVLAASAAQAPLPSACVVDVGLTSEGSWAVVEANAAWASGGYAAEPDGVLDAVLRSGGPAAQLLSRDRQFLRDLPEVTH